MRHFLALLLIVPFITMAQKKGNPEAYAKTITAADLKKHLYIVAGAEMEGREAATEGERKAAAYIEGEFRRIGLQPGNNGSYHMFFPVYRDSLITANLEVNSQKFELDKDFNPNLNNIPALLAFSEVVYLPQNIAADSLKNADLTGRLVMVQGLPQGRSEVLRSKGVAAILNISTSYPRRTPALRLGNQTIQFFKRFLGPQQYFISENVAQTILGTTTQTNGTTPVMVKANVQLEVQKKTSMTQSSNIVGLLPGTDLKDEYLCITAHYDHEGKRGDSVIYYGADDDGSGTVSVIELAEAFMQAKKAGYGPRRSIIFMTVSGEEKGLWGSAHYAANPIFPLEKTTADLNIDMVGRIDPKRTKGDSTNYVYIVGDDKLSSDLRKINVAANKYTKLELDYKYNDPDDKEFIYYRSDHYNFARNGVPIIFYFNGTHRDYHRPTDTPDKINYPLMAKRAQLVFYTAWDMANRNEMLKRDLPLPALRRQF
ncbi:MAG: M28 family peptidase [Flavisolibacter sp.]|nr:M28 family peptidase [Flavisolibacter sp.]